MKPRVSREGKTEGLGPSADPQNLPNCNSRSTSKKGEWPKYGWLERIHVRILLGGALLRKLAVYSPSTDHKEGRRPEKTQNRVSRHPNGSSDSSGEEYGRKGWPGQNNDI